jgi:hypothetical protein
MLVKVNAGKGETYINISLEEIAQVVISHNGEPGYAFVRGARSSVELKDGRKYLTDPDEAKRIVAAMRKQDDAKVNS